MSHTFIYDIFTYEEIIARFLKISVDLEGPTGFPVEINFYANNRIEPPTISVKIFDEFFHNHETLFEAYIDQNTSYLEFTSMLQEMSSITDVILKANDQQISLDEAREMIRKEKETEDESNLPF